MLEGGVWVVLLDFLRPGEGGSGGLGFGTVWVLFVVSVSLLRCGDNVARWKGVLGFSSCPSTVKKPPNWISSGSAFPSKVNTPISTVASFVGRSIVSTQGLSPSVACARPAVRTTLLEIVS